MTFNTHPDIKLIDGPDRANERAPLARRDRRAADRGTPDRRSARRPSVSVIIPTLNEAANLPHVFDRLTMAGADELLIVDGHSTDDTVAVATQLRPDARIILQDRRGKGNALACGFAAARGDLIVMIDADGSTDPAEIPSFLRPLATNQADFVKGSRYMPGGGSSDITHLRSAGNRALGTIVNVLFGTKYTDLCYGYSAFKRECLDQLHVTCDGFEVETLINVRAAKAGLSILEVPSHEQERIHGLSNLNAWKDGRRVLKTIAQERVTRLPQPTSAWEPAFREAARGLASPASNMPELGFGLAGAELA